MLYLHETIDIIGDGQQAYMDAVRRRAAHSEETGLSRLFGLWRVIGSTHRWPRVVNLWEMDGWEHWASTLESQFTPEKKDSELAPWWTEVSRWRRGGFDRILEPADGSPTRDELRTSGRRCGVCVQAMHQLHPGAAEPYLRAVTISLRPILEASGLSFLGAWTSVMRSDEVITLWGAPDFRRLCALYARRHADTALRHWADRSRAWRRESETIWLVPEAAGAFAAAPVP